MLEQILIFTLPPVVTVILWLLLRKREEKQKTLLFKIIAVAYFTVAITRLYMADSFIQIINSPLHASLPLDIYGSIVRLLYQVSWTVLPLTAFFPNRVLKNIAVFFCLPTIIMAALEYPNFMKYFMDPTATGNQLPEFIRHMQFSAELILGFIIILYILFINKHKIKFELKEWIYTLALIPGLILLLCPIYVPQSLFGVTGYIMMRFSPASLIWQGIVIVVPFIIYYAFRFKDYDTRYLVCVVLAMALFLSFNMLYLRKTGVVRLPFQLCNVGAYTILLAVITRNNPLFYFSFVMNTTGGIIAMTVPEAADPVLSFDMLHFLFEHSLIIIVPIALASLRIFKRPNKEAFRSAFYGYIFYFLFCFITGTIVNGLNPLEKVNYFYMFDPQVANVFSFLKPAYYDWRIHIGNFIIMPVYQGAIFLLFGITSYVFYKAVAYFFKVADDHWELRKIAIRRWEEKTGKKSKKLLDYPDLIKETPPIPTTKENKHVKNNQV